jgi:hypothetical protein
MGTNGEELPAESVSAGGRARNYLARICLIDGVLFFILLIAALLVPIAQAQQASDCLLCHGPSTGVKNS